ISIASHELKTPLTPLTIQLQHLARASAKGAAPDKVLLLARRAEKHLERLTKLVDQLLDVTRIRSGQLSIVRESLDLVALVREVTDGFAEPMARAGCTLDLRAAGPIVGSWDRSRLQQVVANLL